MGGWSLASGIGCSLKEVPVSSLGATLAFSSTEILQMCQCDPTSVIKDISHTSNVSISLPASLIRQNKLSLLCTTHTHTPFT